MEQMIEELKTVIPFKETTDIGDIVLIVGHNPQMIIYSVVTSIERDPSKKDEWWHIGLTFLTVPLQKVVWTLRTEQMTGQEIFTMGGEKRFFKAIDVEPASLRVDRNPQPEKKERRNNPVLKRVK